MRIVAGIYRGRPICPPDGDGTRPTIDRVREALFSSLYSLRGGFEGAYALDAFAGSGALGLEALSRGAKHVVLCDFDRMAQKAIQANIQALGVQGDVELHTCNVLEKPPILPAHPYDLVLLDPPYRMQAREVLAFLERLRALNALAPQAIISYEHAASEVQAVQELAPAFDFELIAQKKYGKTRITLLRENQ